MVKHEVEYIDLPFSYNQHIQLASTEDEYNNIQDRGDCVRIPFVREEQLKRSYKNSPRMASLEELRIPFLMHLK